MSSINELQFILFANVFVSPSYSHQTASPSASASNLTPSSANFVSGQESIMRGPVCHSPILRNKVKKLTEIKT